MSIFTLPLLLACAVPPEGMIAGECSDGKDNDGNLFTDCADYNCASSDECAPAPAAECPCVTGDHADFDIDALATAYAGYGYFDLDNVGAIDECADTLYPFAGAEGAGFYTSVDPVESGWDYSLYAMHATADVPDFDMTAGSYYCSTHTEVPSPDYADVGSPDSGSCLNDDNDGSVSWPCYTSTQTTAIQITEDEYAACADAIDALNAAMTCPTGLEAW